MIDRKTLGAYLNDHLAGSVAALELIGRLATAHTRTPIGDTMLGFQKSLEQEQDVVRALIAAQGESESKFAMSMAWIGEKVSRLKIGPGGDDESGLMLFEALEVLSVCFWGRRSLWRTLEHLEGHTPGVTGLNGRALAENAEAQIAVLERLRLDASIGALMLPAGASSSTPA